MFRRSLAAGLSLAALLAGFASAKPPDLPMPQNDTLAPPAMAAEEAALFFRVRPSVRRTMASCLLFAANPALALAPTEDYVDFDADDVDDAEPGFVPTLFRLSTWASEQIDVTGFHGYDSVVHPVVTMDWEAPRANVAAPAEGSFPSACPYLRERQGAPDRSAAPLTEIDLSDDVLHNLEMLRQTQLLLENARDLGAAGRVYEALQCLTLAHDLCPGGRLDGRVQEAAAEVFAACCRGSSQDDARRASVAESDATLNRMEQEIERKLSQPITLNFVDVPLRQVIDDLRCGQHLLVYVDANALDQEEISLDQPVSIRLEGVSLRSALNLILRSTHLTYVVKDGVLQITTERAARPQLMRVSYSVADLLDVVPQGPVVASDTEKHTPEEMLIKLITSSIDPKEWLKNRAPASIVFQPESRTLVVNHTAEVQHEVSDLLAALRRLRSPNATEERPDGFPSTTVAPGAAKPFVKAAGLGEVACCKDAGAPISYLEVLNEFAAVELPAHGELYLGMDGSVRMFTQLRQGGTVWHVLYSNGGLSVWASPDGGAPADDDSGD